jgi:splicing factor 3A subunit 2
MGFNVQVDYPEIEEGTKPRYRFMSAYEQRVEPTDKNYM